MKSLAPIALFVYNRIDHTRLTVDALRQNRLAAESELYIFSDGTKNEKNAAAVSSVREFVHSITGFKSVTIIERDKNYGLANSIIDGVTMLVNKFGKIIVVEDDLVTSKYFLEYLNTALDVYADVQEVVSIHGYMYPSRQSLPETFLIRGTDCWGWATWKRGWDLFEKDSRKLLDELQRRDLLFAFDWDGSYDNTRMLKQQINGKVDSWAIRWYASALLKEKLTLFPGVSLVNNIGGDSEGTHTKSLEEFQTTVAQAPLNVKRLTPLEDVKARAAIVEFYKSVHQSVFQKTWKKIITYF
ncbi:MAG: glycosyltransferase [Bacteroidota bacterium]|nr:glycosyltransferase [Bacteroidota bacterium]